MLQELLTAMWAVLLSLAPWLLGMVIAGILHVTLPPGFVHRQLRGRSSVLARARRAALLRRDPGRTRCSATAPAGATVGFLINTPQTGVD